MQDFLGSIVGKTIRLLLFYRKRGGHALPGLVIEKLVPGYVSSMLSQLPEGFVIITGTNGKTTTTKIVTDLLKANGKRVLTNPTGSNLVRGIASSLASHATISGKLKYDIAILEVDEATARRLVGLARPRWVLALNVSRDQLDRFGEIDTIAAHVGAAMAAASEGVVTNSLDPNLVNQAKQAKAPVYYFGVSPKMYRFFPSDYELAAVDSDQKTAKESHSLDVELSGFKAQEARFRIAGQEYVVQLRLSGQHNFLNCAAALALCRRLLPDAPPQDLINGLSSVSLAFGRGERYHLNSGAEVELVLVKNPASFAQALLSYGNDEASFMIAINDNIADGRDVSWLWDVDFSAWNGREVLVASGLRAADMALRLSYDGIKTRNIEPKLQKALDVLSLSPGPKIILSTYTAMLQLYGQLSKQRKRIK